MAQRARDGEPVGLLWLIDSLTAGGAEALTEQFARGHDARRWRLTVAYLKSIGGNEHQAALEQSGVPVVALGARHLRDLRSFRRLLGVLRDRRIELVHAHLAYASIWAAVAGRLRGIPTLASLHVLPGRERLLEREGMRRRLLVAAANRWLSGAVAVSEAAGRAWQAAGIRAAKLRVVHNGVDLGRFDSSPERRARVRARLGWEGSQPVVLSVAVLREGKGVGEALEVVARARERLPRVRLAIAGDGPLRGSLQARAGSLGLDGCVDWLGHRPDVGDLLAGADLFLLPSRDDAFPTVLLEALAAGRAVIASRSGGIPEIVSGGAGRLVDPDDLDGFAGALCELATNPAAAARCGTAGRRRAEDRFSIGAWCGRLDALYRTVLAARPAAARPDGSVR